MSDAPNRPLNTLIPMKNAITRTVSPRTCEEDFRGGSNIAGGFQQASASRMGCAPHLHGSTSPRLIA